MEKLIRNGKVAVIISRGFGSGWSGSNEILAMDMDIALAVEAKDWEAVKQIVVEKFGEEHEVSFYGLEDCVIRWVDIGRKFIIEEYDGAESIRFLDETNWLEA